MYVRLQFAFKDFITFPLIANEQVIVYVCIICSVFECVKCATYLPSMSGWLRTRLCALLSCLKETISDHT
jgi:hypothetical protein